MENTKYLLEMSNITKEFPGVKALDGANLKVRPHSVHALMGENGKKIQGVSYWKEKR